MPEKKIDRRTLKTRNAIYEGLAELLAEKSLKNITVQELSDKIDIHRVTFYKHFRDIYDVYEQLEQGILNGLERLIVEYGAHVEVVNLQCGVETTGHCRQRTALSVA